MAGKGEEIKGRVKEAAGAVTGNEKLRREGQVEQATGKVKQAVDKVVDKSKEAVQNLKKEIMNIGSSSHTLTLHW